MLRRSGITAFKSVLRHPFRSFPKPISPFLIKSSFSSLPTHQLASNSVLFSSKLNFEVRNRSLFSTEANYDKEVDEINLKFAEAREEKANYDKEVDEINLKFAEAREEIEMAMDAKETVYFNEEAECAKDAVKEVLDMFEGLLSKVNQTQRDALQRSMGLKMEQLKAELQQLEHD